MKQFFLKFNILYYIIFFGFFFIIINFIITIIDQNDLFINYIYKYNYFLSDIILFLKFNNIFYSFFFKFILIIIIIFLIFYLYLNFYKKDNFKKISYLLIHLNLIFIFFLVYFIDNLYFNKSKSLIPFYNNFKFYTHLWIPSNWSVNKFIVKENRNYYLFNNKFNLNLNKFLIHYYNDNTVKNFFSIIILKKLYNFKKFNFKLNYPKFYNNILFYQSSFDNLNTRIKLNLFYLDKFVFKKIFIDTYIGDFIPLNIFRFIHNYKLLEIVSYNNYNYIKFKKLYNFNKLFKYIYSFIYFETINLGPYLKFNIYDINDNIIEYNLYFNVIKENGFRYKLLIKKKNNKDILYKIPIDNYNNIEDFLKFKFIFFNKYCILYLINFIFSYTNFLCKNLKILKLKFLKHLFFLNNNFKNFEKKKIFLKFFFFNLVKLSKMSLNKLNLKLSNSDKINLKKVFNNFKISEINYMVFKPICIKKKYSSTILLKKNSSEFILFIFFILIIFGLFIYIYKIF